MAQKHILLTTDFSEESYRAFAPVIDLAEALGARITLLYVLPTMDHQPTGAPFVSPVPLPTDEELLQRARADLELLRDRFAGVELRLEARVGDDIGDTIKACADELGVDLVALASHGRGGLSRLVMGSVAQRVLKHSTVPVLVVPLRD